MAVDEREAVLDAIKEAQGEFEQMLEWFIQTFGQAVARRGVNEYLQKPKTATDLAAERAWFQALEDPIALNQAINARVQATSWQETLDMLAGGRMPRPPAPPLLG